MCVPRRDGGREREAGAAAATTDVQAGQLLNNFVQQGI